MKWIKQKDNGKNCGQIAVAVITGCSIKKADEAIRCKKYTNAKELSNGLRKLGYKCPSRLKVLKNKPKIAIAKLKKPNKSNWHWVVIYKDKIYDGYYGNKDGEVSWEDSWRITSYLPVEKYEERKYRTQKYLSSCQLISAINARIYLGLPDVNDKLFEELVDLVLCRHGGAISIEKSYPILDIKCIMGKYDYIWISNNLPVEISYYDTKRGFHSSLIVSTKEGIFTLINSPVRRISFLELKKKLLKNKQNQIIKSFKRIESS